MNFLLFFVVFVGRVVFEKQQFLTDSFPKENNEGIGLCAIERALHRPLIPCNRGPWGIGKGIGEPVSVICKAIKRMQQYPHANPSASISGVNE